MTVTQAVLLGGAISAVCVLVIFVLSKLVRLHASGSQKEPPSAGGSTPAREATSEDYAKVVKLLGDGQEVNRRHHWYKLDDGRFVELHYSRPNKNGLYWFGITPRVYRKAKSQHSCKHVVAILGKAGYLVLPVEVVDKYLETASRTNHRHKHVYISYRQPEVVLKGQKKAPDIPVTGYFRAFSS